jgi:hypothetical protein
LDNPKSNRLGKDALKLTFGFLPLVESWDNGICPDIHPIPSSRAGFSLVLPFNFMKNEKEFWGKVIESDNKELSRIERARANYEKTRDKADKKAENKALKKYERELDRDFL